MPRIPETQLQEILEKNDIASIVGEYVALRPAGMGRLKGLCPFHSEKTPSFNVDVEKGFFKCFGCGEGGNLFKFLMKAEHLNFHEAAENLARRVGITLTLDEEERRQITEKERLYDLLERTVEFYQQCLQSDDGRAAREYVAKRGLSAEVVAQFRLGYSPGGNRLLRFLAEKGYTAQEAANAGVARLQSQAGHPVDAFYQRLMFPIADPHGRVISMGGRLLGPGEPKYLNGPETMLFSKGRNLYGLFQSRTAIGRRNEAIVVEGYMDAIALHQYGFPYAVGTLGTALTEDQALLLKRYTTHCVLSYDGDNAGRKAAERGVPIFEAAGLQVKVLMLPEGEDPDTLAARLGHDGFAAMLDKAPGVVDFVARSLARKVDLKTPEGKSEFFRQMAPTLLKIQDDIRRNEYIRKYAEALKVPEEAVRSTLRQAYAPRREAPPGRPLAMGPEERVLAHVLNRPENLGRITGHLGPQHFADEENRSIYRRLAEAGPGVQTLTAATIVTLFPEEGLGSRVTELLLHARGLPLTTESLDKELVEIERSRARLRFRELKAEIARKSPLAPDDPLLGEYKELGRRLAEKR